MSHSDEPTDRRSAAASGSATRLSRKRKLAFIAVATALVLVVALLAGEAVIRIVFPQNDAERWFQADERYGYVLKRNFHQRLHYARDNVTIDVRTNSLGMRDREYDLSRSDAKRVLLLGDSFTFGEGLDAEFIFDTKLETLLNGTGEPWIVLNTGVGGWGTLQQTKYARDHFELFRPDVIVLTICGNDPWDDVAFEMDMKDNDRGRFYFPGKTFLRNHSHLYRFLFRRFRVQLESWILRSRLSKQAKVVVDEQSQRVSTERMWGRTVSLIRDFHRDFRASRPDGVLLVQPANPLQGQIAQTLQSLSNGRDLFYVDLRDQARELGPDNMRMPHDGHWSERMHALSAEALFQAIQAATSGAQ